MMDSESTRTLKLPREPDPLYGTGPATGSFDVVVVIETPVPFMPPNIPKPGATINWVDPEGAVDDYKTMEFHADRMAPGSSRGSIPTRSISSRRPVC